MKKILLSSEKKISVTVETGDEVGTVTDEFKEMVMRKQRNCEKKSKTKRG